MIIFLRKSINNDVLTGKGTEKSVTGKTNIQENQYIREVCSFIQV